MYFSQNGSYLNGFNENATLLFEAGKTYRLRIVNTAAFSMFYFWIDGADLTDLLLPGHTCELGGKYLDAVGRTSPLLFRRTHI